MKIVIFTLFFQLSLPQIYAATLSNQDFLLETKPVNPQPPSGNDQKPLAKIKIEEQEAVVKPFVFSISQRLIDFGLLSQTNPITRTAILSVNPGSATGYVVWAFEDHELSSLMSKIIPDTTCDNGSCNNKIASLWDNILSFGFGYRCDNIKGTDCPASFYKRFSNLGKGDLPEIVMRGTNNGTEKQTKITYKVNISATQDIGLYKNTIQYIAVPDF